MKDRPEKNNTFSEIPNRSIDSENDPHSRSNSSDESRLSKISLKTNSPNRQNGVNRHSDRIGYVCDSSTSESQIEGSKRGKSADHDRNKEENKKTPLDYLVEQAQREQRKMEEVAEMEGRMDRMEREKKYHNLKLQEKILNEEIERLDECSPDRNDLFQSQTEGDVKMYLCPKRDCGKTFPSLSRVRRHYIVHTGEKPYKCLNTDCRKTFSRKDNMLQHYRNHCYLSRKTKFKEFEL